ncbi:MAG: hypothetical protein ACRD16_05870 [Thermoanaerobaculia bacterium]
MLLAILAFLTFLVWGIFAFNRGMFQDETFTLEEVYQVKAGISRFILPVVSPTSVFGSDPYALALLVPSPVAALQFFYGVTWLAGGVFTAIVLAQIFPRRRWLAFAGGCLTICATGDYLADSLVALTYEVSALFSFVMLACQLAFLKTGKLRWLAMSVAALAISLGNTDVAFAPIVLTPALLWLVEGRFSRRVKTASLAMACVFGPYLVVFARFLVDPHSYAAIAIEPMTLAARAHRVVAAYLHNFAPWTWGRMRRNWFPPLPVVVPNWIRIWGPVAGALAFLAGSRRLGAAIRNEEPAGSQPARDLLFVAAFLTMALACNSTQGILHYAQFFYRSQILSRFWASMAVALASGLLLRMRSPLRWVGILLALTFVGLGVDGGLDRQDYYLAYWKRHRVELESIVRAVPRLKAPARLVLRIPEPPPYFLATQADYLAQSWATLLEGDPSMWDRTFLIGPYGDQRCAVEGANIVCRNSKSEVLSRVNVSESVVLSYHPAENRYLLDSRLPPEISRGSADSDATYRPRRWIVAGPVSPMARRLLE